MGRCGKCKHTWTGIQLAHCSGCHLDFGSDTAFDRHREGTYEPDDRHCIPVERFAEPRRSRQGARGDVTEAPRPPLLVLGGTPERPVWVTALRDFASEPK